jgi:cytochrome c oxidase subunit 1
VSPARHAPPLREPHPDVPPVPGAEVTALDRDTATLTRTWSPPPGVLGWLLQVNHRAIGKRFIVTAFVFFVLGGLEALVMRLQLGGPERGLVDADTYGQLFTMHGTTMMFFFAVPVVEGLFIYLVPLMLGTRDMAFPRLNAFGYWVYLIGGAVLYGAFFLGAAPDAGWFSYVPLADRTHSPGIRVDLWATMITFVEVSALVAAVEIIATIFKQRPPGMSINRMPLFVWAALVTAFMIVFAMPAVVSGSILLALDRTAGTWFFEPSGGGAPLLWQHLFWFFGHPEVYIILVPALGMVASIVTASAQRPMFGYTAIALAMTAIGIASFGLWVHHMFATGLPALGAAFFTAASILIAVPSGVQIFCWTGTLWGSRPRVTVPLLYVFGFVFLFVIGGITGVMVASVPFDQQVHDSYFVVAHFHYVLIGGMVMPLFGAVHFWFPKLTGRLLSDRAGALGFWLLMAGFNVTFFPMHQLGFLGMPRRVYTYLAASGWEGLNLTATVGAFVITAGVLVNAGNVLVSLRRGAPAPANPWGADTLEWGTTSPPPQYNFDAIPVVEGRYPMWERQASGESPVVVGLSDTRREVLLTTLLDARPDGVAVLPAGSLWPLALALSVAVAFLGTVWSLWWVPVGAALAFASLVGWHWPRDEERTPPWRAGDRADARRPVRARRGAAPLAEEPA